MKAIFLSAVAALSLSAGVAAGATIDIDFDSPVSTPLILMEDSPGVIPGNCDGSASGPKCLGVNKNGAASISIESPLTFSISSFWFKLLGNNDDLIVTTNKGVTTLLESVYDHNLSGDVLDVSGNAFFQDITFMSFLTSEGNARVDDLKGSYVSAVPLPAAGWLMLVGLGGLFAVRRQRTT
ncbi:hypothetical protein ACSSVY_003475 [Roseovarius sp. MBR-51]